MKHFHGFAPLFRAAGYLLGALLVITLPATAAQPPVLTTNFSDYNVADNPWAGVSTKGPLYVISGKQPVVDDTGAINGGTDFGPSVGVGDLNGDGLQDLVMGDGKGFFWFFPNSGTPNKPAFTHGEVMPVWLGFYPRLDNVLEFAQGGAENVIPHLQLIDLTNSGKLDIVAGNYAGRLFIVKNRGTPSVPSFKMPDHVTEMEVPTRANGVLWTNFLCPFLYDWYGTKNLDLILGDGSYSANSIFLIANQGSSDRPIFRETNTVKIIPGMGREHLTPQVVDWNNDGKPDIITGERTGYITVFLNQSTDPKKPAFDTGQHISVGGQETFGSLVNVTVCDLNGNKLPNLIITNSDGQILYAKNKGTLGHPQFDAPTPLTGKNPFDTILLPGGWWWRPPAGLAKELLVTTNAQKEPGFTGPPDTGITTALRYYVFDTHPKVFTHDWYPPEDKHSFGPENTVNLNCGTRYKISFWIRCEGVTNLGYNFVGFQNDGKDEVDAGSSPVSGSASWSQFTGELHMTSRTPDKNALVPQRMEFAFYGQGSIYITGLVIAPEE